MKLDWRLQFSQRRSQLLMSGLMCCLGIGIGCIPQAGGGAPVIVSYAPANLSDAIAKFFTVSTEFFVLQICRNELVFVPYSKMSYGIKKEVTLSIPFSQIRKITVEPKGQNYFLIIETDKDDIVLSVQQKELSGFRTSGFLGSETTLKHLIFPSNWHKENLDATLEALKKIGTE